MTTKQNKRILNPGGQKDMARKKGSKNKLRIEELRERFRPEITAQVKRSLAQLFVKVIKAEAKKV